MPIFATKMIATFFSSRAIPFRQTAETSFLRSGLLHFGSFVGFQRRRRLLAKTFPVNFSELFYLKNEIGNLEPGAKIPLLL